MRPVVLTVAGSDPTGGAGIQADLKAIEASHAWAATAITAITVQNSKGVERWEPVAAELVIEQMAAVFDDFDVRVVKLGMLPTRAIVAAVAAYLRGRGVPIVLDPVLRAGHGEALGEDHVAEALRRELVPFAALVTPNAHEAERLTGRSVRDAAEARAAGAELLRLGAAAALIKGGHLERDRATDVLVTAAGIDELSGAWITTPHGHGTGCTYASAIAARLARGFALVDAVREAKAFTAEALRHARPIGAGGGPVDVFHAQTVDDRA